MAGRPTFSARTVRWGEEFEAAAAAIQPDTKRFDEQMRGVEWVVATKPENYALIPGTVLRIIKTDPWPDAPELRIFFSLDDDDRCTLHWVELADTLPDEEDLTE